MSDSDWDEVPRDQFKTEVGSNKLVELPWDQLMGHLLKWKWLIIHDDLLIHIKD